MLSRRLFLLASLGLSVCPSAIAPLFARSKTPRPVYTGPRSISKLVWPPALVPDHIGFADKSNIVISDDLGQVAILDLNRADNTRIIGKVAGVGKRIVDFFPASQRAYAICSNDSPSGDPAYVLVSISLVPAAVPSVMSQMLLEHFAEPVCLTVHQELICVGGIANNGAHIVAIYRRQKSQNPSLISSFVVQAPIYQLDLQDKGLVILQLGRGTQIDYVSLYYPHAPHLRKSIVLDGEYRVMARYKEFMMVAGQPGTKKEFDVRSILLEPSPHAVANAPLSNISRAMDAAAQKGRFFVLAEGAKGPMIVTYSYDKVLDLTVEDTILLPDNKGTPGLLAQLAVKERNAYVAAGWAGISVLSLGKTGWHYDFTYAIPRLSAACMAVGDNSVVLGSADLKVYNLTRPDKPSLDAAVDLKEPVKNLVAIGKTFLCLTKNTLTWRKLEDPAVILTSVNLTGHGLTYDRITRKAFVLAQIEKKTVIYPVNLMANHLAVEDPLELPLPFKGVFAFNGFLAFRALNDISLYQFAGVLNLIGTRHFDNLAIRDISLSSNLLAATAVDRNSRGFLLLLSNKDTSLKPLGVTDVTNDGAALSLSEGKAAVLGQSPEGKDTLAVFDLTMPALPKALASLSVLEAASAVAIKENLAIVAGRGLEILSL